MGINVNIKKTAFRDALRKSRSLAVDEVKTLVSVHTQRHRLATPPRRRDIRSEPQQEPEIITSVEVSVRSEPTPGESIGIASQEIDVVMVEVAEEPKKDEEEKQVLLLQQEVASLREANEMLTVSAQNAVMEARLQVAMRDSEIRDIQLDKLALEGDLRYTQRTAVALTQQISDFKKEAKEIKKEKHLLELNLNDMKMDFELVKEERDEANANADKAKTAAAAATAYTESAKALIDLVVEKATCVVCLEYSVNPQVLPCTHLVCRSCTVGILYQTKKELVKCPMCRASGAASDAYNLDQIFKSARALVEAATEPAIPDPPTPSRRSKRGQNRAL